eukprot:15332935-Alexandrium_andersonii.AAC.1
MAACGLRRIEADWSADEHGADCGLHFGRPAMRRDASSFEGPAPSSKPRLGASPTFAHAKEWRGPLGSLDAQGPLGRKWERSSV